MKTKAISLILVLAMILTIGGVYASWMYAEKTLTAVHGHIGSFGLANAVLNISKGTVTVNAEGAHLIIDQAAENNYEAVLRATGTITITFQPSDTFKNTNSDHTFNMNFCLTTTNPNPTGFMCPDGNGGEKELFTQFDKTIRDGAVVTLTKLSDGSGNYVGTIDVSELTNRITLNDFTLNSYEKYEAFSIKIGTFGNIGIEVSEIPQTTTP